MLEIRILNSSIWRLLLKLKIQEHKCTCKKERKFKTTTAKVITIRLFQNDKLTNKVYTLESPIGKRT